ncbi:MAG: AraC family transcriptional regulator [Anaerovoracaceae bacterium]
MLKEKIVYKEGLPVNLTVANIYDYPIHFHNDLEVVYVLDGTIRMKNGYYSYILKQGDIFILNAREIHNFESNGERNMVMLLQFDLDYFSRYYDNLRNSFFVTDMEEDPDESLDVLRNLLAHIMMEVIQKGQGYEAKVIESAHNLISNLFADFQYFLMEDGRFINETKHKGNKILAGRLSRITDYMYDNYSRKLTLSEIAEREHLSIYYLSHIIKEATGLSFQELLSFMRVEESEKLLLGTNKKIGAIAEEMGFSAVRYFIKHFEIWYGMHPLEYKKKYAGRVASPEITHKMEKSSPEAIENAIRNNVKGVYNEFFSVNKAEPIIVDVDIHEEIRDAKIPDTYPMNFLDDDIFKPVSRHYTMFKSLKEKVLASGSYYIVSTSARALSGLNSVSILVYHINPEMIESLSKQMNREYMLELIKQYEKEQEVLIRLSGLSGEYRISRYKMTKQSATASYEEALKTEGLASKRKAIINSWRTLPVAEFGRLAITDTLSVRSTLKGIGAELILIDKQVNIDL